MGCQSRLHQQFELLVNRAALNARLGQAALAEAELRGVLERSPGLPPALSNLAFAVELQGRDASALRARAEAARSHAPRGFPYAVGNGDPRFIGGNQRWMLVASHSGLELYRPPHAR